MSLRKISNRRKNERYQQDDSFGIDVSGDIVRFNLRKLYDNTYALVYNNNKSWDFEIPFSGDEEDIEYGIRELINDFMIYEWEDEKGVKSYEIESIKLPTDTQDGEVVISLKTIINEYEPYAKKVIKDEDGWYSVLVADKNSDWEAWVDIRNDEKYPECVWNQDIFSTYNTRDILTRYLQDIIYEQAFEVAEDAVSEGRTFESKKRPLRKSEKRHLTRRIKESHCDKEQLIYDFILDNELCTEGELDMAVDVGGFNEETLNYVIYRQTAYHDIEQLWDCEKDNFYFNDDVIECFDLKDDEEDFDESKKAPSRKVKRNEIEKKKSVK